MKKRIFETGNNEDNPLYIQLYEHYRQLICSGVLRAGAKMPSIRRCSSENVVSKTTVEAAYMLLSAEGYIIARPQSGYTVCDIGEEGSRLVSTRMPEPSKPEKRIDYSFLSSSADEGSFSLAVWSRYVKSALRQGQRLLSYGEPQGEEDLRQAVCSYAARQRGVVCTPEQVIIGAGMQSLLHILCAVIDKPEAAAFTGPFFVRGSTVLSDHGIRSVHYSEFPDDPEKLVENGEGLIYISPSHMTEWGEVLPVSKRRTLLKLAAENNCLILEDDYDSEFRYYSRPVPSLQSIDSGGNVIYFGTFSKLLIPSIRISFMVLPEKLLASYKKISSHYNQTASKTEQIALCQYIRDGRLYAQIRKLRKLYITKSNLLCEEVNRVFDNKATAIKGSAGYLIRLEIKSDKSSHQLAALAENAGIAVAPLKNVDGKRPMLLLCCSGVPAEDFHEALVRLRAAIEL